ncbi:MAG: YXWGXW repeat-containing protein [Chthoniobacterales bacterium]
MQLTSAFRNLLLALVMGGTPLASFAQVAVGVGVSINVAPPPLPVYDQPPCPADGDIWIPGYWAYGDDGYYWVAGYWADPPEIGFLWTPGYWGYSGGFYVWHGGYWGPDVGFYGGVNYGFGYGGIGYYGGRWEGGAFYYNTAVTNVNRRIVRNTYVDRTNHVTTNSRVSFNGPGGVTARPTAQQRVAMRERHIQATAAQVAHQQNAAKGRNQSASVNRAHPTRNAVATVGRHPTVNPSRSNTNRVNNTSTKANANVGTTSRNGRLSTTTGVTKTVRQARAVHVNRVERTSVAQAHRTIHSQSSTRTAAIRHSTPVRQNHITPTAHATNRVAFEHRTPARHAPAPARRGSTPAHHAQPQQNRKHA